MVAFATIFLGLVLGLQVVEVAVEGPVAVLEVRVDGRPVAVRSEPPWYFVVDFGDTYEPHVLEAVALGEDGEELGRAEQWLNVPRDEVEAEIALSGGTDGSGVVAKVLWESRVEARPEEVRVTFDGRPLVVVDPERIALPDHDPLQLHLLQVELRFRGDYTAVVERTFGGTYSDRVETRLTAVPIALAKGAKAPEPAEIGDRFVDGDGKPLQVMAVDEGPAELVVVRDAAAQRILERLVETSASRTLYRRAGSGRVITATNPLRHAGQLRRNQILRFLYPVTVELYGHRTRQEQFPTSRAYSGGDGGLAWLMSRETRALEPERQRLAEAVAVAGMAAAMNNRRRAVLLLVSRDPADVSRIRPAVARRYLETLRVPFEVWALDDPRPAGSWGPQRSISNLGALHAATRDLARSLDRQRIVWLRGRHLPQKIALRGRSDFELAR